MISDCEKCWNTPCVCGWQYRDWPTARLDKLILALQQVKLAQAVKENMKDDEKHGQGH